MSEVTLSRELANNFQVSKACIEERQDKPLDQLCTYHLVSPLVLQIDTHSGEAIMHLQPLHISSNRTGR